MLGDGDVIGATRLAPAVERSWRRCLAMGLSPDERIGFDLVSANRLQEAIDRTEALRTATAPVIAQLAHAAAESGHFALLTDASGIVVSAHGQMDRCNRRVQLMSRVGLDLSEPTLGSNAIGLALAEAQPGRLHRGEHFFEDVSTYSGAGAPVFGPDGQCVAALALTGVNVPERPGLQHLVTRAAIDMQAALQLAQPHHLALHLNWPGHHCGSGHDGLLTVDAEGRITGANRAAADMLALSTAPWPHCDEVFVDAVGRLFDTARLRRPEVEWPLRSGLRVRVLARLKADAARTPVKPAAAAPGLPLRELEVALIRQAVETARGNVMQAARALGISRATVYRRLKRRDPVS